MLWIAGAVVLLLLGAVFTDPEFSGEPLVKGLARVPRGTPSKAEPVAQAALVEVVAAPSGRWPLVKVSLGFWRNDAGPRWAKVRVLEASGDGPLKAGAEVALDHWRLEPGQRFVVCLNARGESVDGYLADAAGKVSLVDDTPTAEPIAPFASTPPMAPADAFPRLVGKPPSTIPTKFRP